MKIPATTSRIPLPTTSRNPSRARAPRAMRTPISLVRRATEKDSKPKQAHTCQKERQAAEHTALAGRRTGPGVRDSSTFLRSVSMLLWLGVFGLVDAQFATAGKGQGGQVSPTLFVYGGDWDVF